jgi:hypothetical protein
MNRNIDCILELKNSHPLFNAMSRDAIDVLFNIEILLNNKFDLDYNYHDPLKFIVNINNFIRNIDFVIEKASKLKSKYLWLYNSISQFKQDYNEDYELMRNLRNSSVHKELLIPEGAFAVGLYRINTRSDYKYKLGFGQIKDLSNLPIEYVFSSTYDIFHKLLTFHYLMFMDIKHSALNECLGISRSWKIKYSYKSSKKIKLEITTDIYNKTIEYFDNLITYILNGYSESISQSIPNRKMFNYSEYNFINTILEVDLYPCLFSKLWENDITPLNWKESIDYNNHIDISTRNEKIIELYKHLPNNKFEYVDLLTKYSNFQLSLCENQQEYDLFIGFILFPHWFIKVLEPDSIMKIDTSLIYQIQTKSIIYCEKYNTNFEKTSIAEKDENIKTITILLKELLKTIE